MGLLRHIKLGLEDIETATVFPTTIVDAVPQTKMDGEGNGFLQATGEALRQIGEMILADLSRSS